MHSVLWAPKNSQPSQLRWFFQMKREEKGEHKITTVRSLNIKHWLFNDKRSCMSAPVLVFTPFIDLPGHYSHGGNWDTPSDETNRTLSCVQAQIVGLWTNRWSLGSPCFRAVCYTVMDNTNTWVNYSPTCQFLTNLLPCPIDLGNSFPSVCNSAILLVVHGLGTRRFAILQYPFWLPHFSQFQQAFTGLKDSRVGWDLGGVWKSPVQDEVLFTCFHLNVICLNAKPNRNVSKWLKEFVCCQQWGLLSQDNKR